MATLVLTEEYFPIDDNVIGYVANSHWFCKRDSLKIFIDPELKKLFFYIVNPIRADINQYYNRGIYIEGSFFNEFDSLQTITKDKIPEWILPTNRYYITKDYNTEHMLLPKDTII